jgi:hypothetical protein
VRCAAINFARVEDFIPPPDRAITAATIEVGDAVSERLEIRLVLKISQQNHLDNFDSRNASKRNSGFLSIAGSLIFEIQSWWRCDAQFSNTRDFGVPYASGNGRFSKPPAFVTCTEGTVHTVSSISTSCSVST